jgi:hypothetical protein
LHFLIQIAVELIFVLRNCYEYPKRLPLLLRTAPETCPPRSYLLVLFPLPPRNAQFEFCPSSSSIAAQLGAVGDSVELGFLTRFKQTLRGIRLAQISAFRAASKTSAEKHIQGKTAVIKAH